MKFEWNYEESAIIKYANDNTLQCVLIFLTSFLLYKLIQEKNSKKLPPGPIGLPFLGYLPFLGKEPHKALLKLSQKYGNIISLRMGPKLTVVLNDWKLMKDVLSHNSALFRAPELFHHIPKIGFITANGEEWSEQRRFSMHSMRDLGIGRSEWEELVSEEVTEFLEELRSHGGKPVEISHRLNAAISSNVLSLLIGRRLCKKAEKDKIKVIVDYSDVSFTYMGPSLLTSLVPSLWKIFQFLGIAGYDRAAAVIANFRDIVVDEIRKHQTQAESKVLPDFINSYLKEQEQKMSAGKTHYFSEENLEGNAKILFLGASDTIFSSLGWIFRLMCEHPEVQKKIQDELDEVIGIDGSVSYKERFKIPYTFAVLMESQRFSSIVPLSTTRTAAYDFQVQDYTIPKGTEIFANMWAVHNDPDYWDEPEKFRPERFLTNNNTKLEADKPSYAPFSIGRRNCPGETVAWMEILVFFTSILQKFNIAMPPGVKPEFKIVNGLVAHLKPQPLRFIERPGRFA